jgi:hypothetical protein
MNGVHLFSGLQAKDNKNLPQVLLKAFVTAVRYGWSGGFLTIVHNLCLFIVDSEKIE